MAFGSASERLQFILDFDTRSGTAELQRFSASAERELAKVDNRVDRLGTRMQTAGAGMVAAAGVAGAALFSLGQDAAELEQAVGGTTAIFGEASATIDRFAESSSTSMGLSERAFREATTSIGGNLKRMGFDVDEAAERSVELTGVAADLAATYGGTTAEAVQALGAAFRGEADPAERFNLNLKASVVAAKAVELGLAENTREVSENARAQALLALITEQSADAQGQFARESDTASGKMQIATAELENMRAELGGAVAPVIADVAGGVADLAGWIGDLNEATDGGVGKFASYATGAVALAGALSFAGGTAVKMRGQLTGAIDVARRGVTAFGALSTTVKGFAAVGAVAAIAAITEELNDANASVDELVTNLQRARDAELLAAWEDMLGEINEVLDPQSTSTISEFFDDVAESSLATAERLREVAEEAGYSEEALAAMDAILADTASGNRQAAEDAAANADSTDRLTESTESASAASDEHAEALDRASEALERKRDATESLLGNQLDLEEQLLRTAEQLETYAEVMEDGEATDRDRQQAGIDLLNQFLATAEAARQNAEDQATAAGRAESATQEGVDAQIASLLSLAQNLEPGSPLRQRLEDYIAQLGRIPRTIDTNVQLRITAPRGTGGTQILNEALGDPSNRAVGGRFRAGELLKVGEDGEELVIFDRPGTVLGASDTRKALGFDASDAAAAGIAGRERLIGDLSATTVGQFIRSSTADDLEAQRREFERFAADFARLVEVIGFAEANQIAWAATSVDQFRQMADFATEAKREVDEVAEAERRAAEEAERAAERRRRLGEEIRERRARVEAEARESAGDVFAGVAGAGGSVDDLEAALDERRQAVARFTRDLQAIAASGATDVARTLAGLGVERGGALAAELVRNPSRLRELEADADALAAREKELAELITSGLTAPLEKIANRPTVHIEHYHQNDATDVDMLGQRLAFAAAAGSFS